MSTKDTLKRWGSRIGGFFRGTLIGRVIIFLSLPLLIIAALLWKPNTEPPIFDAQAHYNREVWRKASAKMVLKAANGLNVPWMLVCALPNEGTWRLYERDPERVIPMLVPYQSHYERDTWFKDPNTLAFIEKEITSKPYRGIGEFHLFSSQANTPVVSGMVALARKHNLILNARSDEYAINKLFALEPNLRIIWAHGGMFNAPEEVDAMLARHPQLWVEISHRDDVAPDGKLSPAWRALMLRYPARFLLGSGTYTMENWYRFRYFLSDYRDLLKQLPPDVAEQIAYRNGVELFGLKPREDPKDPGAKGRAL